MDENDDPDNPDDSENANHERSANGLLAWLKTKEALAALKKMTRALLKEARGNHLCPDAIRLGAGLTEPEAADALLAALTEFMLANPSLRKCLTGMEPHQRTRYLCVSFRNHWRARSLSEGGDPWRRLRKRIYDTLRKTDGFITRALPAPARYTRDPDSLTLPHLTLEDLSAVPFPDDALNLTEKTIRSARRIPGLAGSFWTHISERAGHPAWIEISDLTTWIARHIPLGAADGGDLDDPERAYPEPPDEGRLSEWAMRFGRRLDPRRRAVFLYRGCQGASLADTARQIGVRSPQTVANDMEDAGDMLRDYCRELPGLSEDDFDERAAEIFIEKLCAALEKCVSRPL